MPLEPLPLPERKTRKVALPPPPPPAAWPAFAVLLAGMTALGLGLVPALSVRLMGLAPRDLQYAGLVLLALGGLLLVRRALLVSGVRPDERAGRAQQGTGDEPAAEKADFPAFLEAEPELPAVSPIDAGQEPIFPPRPPIPPALFGDPAGRPPAGTGDWQGPEDGPPGPSRPAGAFEELLVALSIFLASTVLIGGVIYLELQWFWAGAPHRFAGFGGLGALVLVGLLVRAARSRGRRQDVGEQPIAARIPPPARRRDDDIDLMREVAVEAPPAALPRRKVPRPTPETVPPAKEPPERGPTGQSPSLAPPVKGEGVPPVPTPPDHGPAVPVRPGVAGTAGKDKDARAAAAPLRLVRPGKVGVGLDIGAAHIKLVQVRGTRRGAVVTGFGAAPTPRAAVTEGGIVKPLEVAEAVRRLMRETGVRGRRVVTAIGGPGVILRQVQFPRMGDGELREALKWEAEQHIPIPPDEAITDFSILGDAPPDPAVAGAPAMRVMLVGTRRNLVQGLLETMRATSLYLVAIDIDVLATTRVLAANGHHPRQEDASVMLVDLGASGTKLSVFRGGLPAFNRTLGVGGNNFTAAIAEGLGQDMAAAEMTKRELGVLPDTAAARFLQPLLDELLLEIRRSIEFYLVRHERTEIRHILLAGGGAGLKGLPDALSDYLMVALDVREEESELKVTLLDPLHELDMHPRLGDRRDEFGPQFTGALGLALREGR